MAKYCARNNCRICLSSDLIPILDLGSTPPANAFISKAEINKHEDSFPLRVSFCGNCSLLQLIDVVDPQILFGDYHFLTSASSPSVEHFKEYGKEIKDRFLNNSQDLVVDIGGNDGTLLLNLKDEARVLNVEPASNVAQISASKDIETLNSFFSVKTANEIVNKYGKASVITANNVLAHSDEVREIFQGMTELLSPGGVLIFEVHWVKNLLDGTAFDQVYHEHLCFYSLHAAKYLIESVGLKLFDVKIIPTQGQSLRIYASLNREALPSVKELLDLERKNGLTDSSTFKKFSSKVGANKQKLRELLFSLKAEGKKIVGYGAPAKGNTLLNFFEIDNSIIDYITDTTSLKQGLYTPGTHIPVVHPERLDEETPDYILLLAWNFTESILKKESKLRERGVKFITVIPEISVI